MMIEHRFTIYQGERCRISELSGAAENSIAVTVLEFEEPEVADGTETYHGSRSELPVYLDEVNHSPDGFEWGYLGYGPAQLAYAILRHRATATGQRPPSPAVYQRFKLQVVATLSEQGWALGGLLIDLVRERIEREVNN